MDKGQNPTDAGLGHLMSNGNYDLPTQRISFFNSPAALTVLREIILPSQTTFQALNYFMRFYFFSPLKMHQSFYLYISLTKQK